MKTKKQIEHFLSRRKYKSEMDYEGISLYCKNKFKIKLHRPSRYFPEPVEDIVPLDYATFAEWLEHGYGAGDVVEWGENIGLVQDGGLEKVRICLKIDGNIPIFDYFILNVHLIRKAEESALNRIYDVLSKKGKEFGNPFFCITEKFIPESNSIVAFQNNITGKSGAGVVRTAIPDDKLTMYCYYIKGEPVKYSMEEDMGNTADYSFQQVQTSDYPRKALETALERVGKTWNHSLKRIEPLNMKAEKGENYYYINDKRIIVCETEKGTPTSHKRYLAGNYFRERNDAAIILKEEDELRKRFFAKPEVGEEGKTNE